MMDQESLSGWSSLKDAIVQNDGKCQDHKALHMMVKMGYKAGSGLGKNEQGILEPVSISAQRGRYGLGQIAHLDITNADLESTEDIVLDENVEWLPWNQLCPIIEEIPSDWMVEGPLTDNMDNECHFCDPNIFTDLLKAKGIFDIFNPLELCKARARANPFETLHSAFFMNRAALKIANIDAITEFLFTGANQNVCHEKENGLLYFADVCAGPGGFTEYMLWRKGWKYKGFGFTLKQENDFQLFNSGCASPASFQALYGANGDGDVCCPENIQSFKESLLLDTHNEGVHFMMSDGGFCVDGKENMQEILSKQLYLSQCLVALEVVRPNGYFVTKLFDTFTPFSIGLIYLMWKCFNKVCIIKPNSSRPANSERYLICYGLLINQEMKIIRRYLRKIVNKLWEMRHVDDNSSDIIEIVPLDILKGARQFFEYIRQINNRIGLSQIKALLKIAKFCQNPLLSEPRQEELRKECLKKWLIPDKPKTAPRKHDVDVFLSTTFQEEEFTMMPPQELADLDSLSSFISSMDYHFCFLSSVSDYSHIFAGLGNSHAHKINSDGSYSRVKNLYLPFGTLLLGEFVRESEELEDDDTCVTKKDKYSLHVIDAFKLGEMKLEDVSFRERRTAIETFCEAINFECNPRRVRVRAKPVHLLLEFNTDCLKYEENTNRCKCIIRTTKKWSYVINSILLLNTRPDFSFIQLYESRVIIPFDEKFSFDDFNSFIKRHMFVVT